MIKFKIIKSLLVVSCLFGVRFAFADQLPGSGDSAAQPTDCKPNAFAEEDTDANHCAGLRASNKRIKRLAADIADTDLAKRANITAEDLLQDDTTLCRIKERIISCNGKHGVPWDKVILADFRSRQAPGEPDPRTEAGTGCASCSDKDRAIAELKDINDRLRADREKLERRLDDVDAKLAAAQAAPPPAAVAPPPPPPPPPPPRRDSLADTLNDPRVQLGELLGRLGMGPGGMQMPQFGQFGQSPFGPAFGQQPFGQPIMPYGPQVPYFAQMPQYMRPITPAIPVGGGLGFGGSIGAGIGIGGSFGGIGGGFGAGVGGPTGITPPALAPYIH